MYVYYTVWQQYIAYTVVTYIYILIYYDQHSTECTYKFIIVNKRAPNE